MFQIKVEKFVEENTSLRTAIDHPKESIQEFSAQLFIGLQCHFFETFQRHPSIKGKHNQLSIQRR